jgi:hypothetical protein
MWSKFLNPPRNFSNPGVAPPTFAESMARDLCLARYKIENAAQAVGAEIWKLLGDLESELAAFWDWMTQAWPKLKQWGLDLGRRIKNFLNWLDGQLAKAEGWLLAVGVGLLLWALAPAINDTTHAATSHWRKK